MTNKAPESSTSTSMGVNISLDQKTVQNTHNILALKQRVIDGINSDGFPDLGFLFSDEVLEIAEKLLGELLKEEKEDFQNKLKLKDEEINFDIFQDFSLLEYYFSLLEHYAGVHNDEQIRKIVEDFEPQLVAFGNEVAYSKRYYEMYKYYYEQLIAASELSQKELEQKRILEETLKAYRIRGIDLDEEKQNELKSISQELSELSQKFSNNVVDSRKAFEYIIRDASSISEMPEDDKNAAKKRADEKNIEGFLFDASQSSMMAIMKYCSDTDIRKHFFDARNSFASSGEYDNQSIILKILELRHTKAQILGYTNYAELSLEFKMADSPEQIIDLFGDISTKARPKAQEEIEEIKNYFSLTNLEQWDLGYYARKLKEEKYALDERELKKYFVFENVLSGMFETAHRLYGIEMKELKVKSYNSQVQVYEVSKDGAFLSYFFTDYFYNPLKRPGAWANILREKTADKKKLVLNVCNFQKSSDGKTLLTLGDVETMFHEFGHAIHEMLSRSYYGDLSGFHVERDFVELPSQLMENWCRDRVGMKLFARHFESGDDIPENMLKTLQALETFGNGQFVMKQNEFAMLDMLLYTSTPPSDARELQELVEANYKKNSLFPLPDGYMQHCSFSHIFDGGYAAGYYSYMWAEIIEKEVWKHFKDSGDIFSREISELFYEKILSAGSTKKASELFRDFLGRDPEIDAFLQEKGLV